MNLNEECLLLYLQGTRPTPRNEAHEPPEAARIPADGGISRGGYASAPRGATPPNPLESAEF